MRNNGLFERWAAVAAEDGAWPVDIVFEGASANTESKAADACERAAATDVRNIERALAEHELRHARRSYDLAWATDQAARELPDPMAAVNDERARESAAISARRNSPEGRQEKTIELLQRVVELLEAGGR